MKNSSDILVAGIVLTAVSLAAFSPVTGVSYHLQGGVRTPFSESLLLTAAPAAAEPDPAIFQAMDKAGRIVMGIYAVRPHDTLSSIAKNFSTTPDSLRSTNHLEKGWVAVGKP